MRSAQYEPEPMIPSDCVAFEERFHEDSFKAENIKQTLEGFTANWRTMA